jgi:hypothetical protein
VSSPSSLRRVAAVVALAFFSACSSAPPKSCRLSPERRELVMRNITAAINELSTSTVTYSIEMALNAQGDLHAVKGGLVGVKGTCYAYLFPVSRSPSSGILDGDGALIIDPDSMRVLNHVWFKY